MTAAPRAGRQDCGTAITILSYDSQAIRVFKGGAELQLPIPQLPFRQATEGKLPLSVGLQIRLALLSFGMCIRFVVCLWRLGVPPGSTITADPV